MSTRIVPPSTEVRQHALARAEALSAGLFTHQIEGVAFLLGRNRAILADDMGLGKTRQSIVALTEARPQGPYLVVCPASVKQNWRREILNVHPDANVVIAGTDAVPDSHTGWVVINYDLLRRNLDQLLSFTWQGIVFDEAHYLKNHGSQRSRQARKLADAADGACIHLLTGTPLTNRPRDLFPLLQLTGHPMGRSFLSFAKRYCAAHHNGYGWVTDGASNLEDLRTELHGLMLRRTKDDVLDLPPKVRSWLPIEIPHGVGRREARKVLELLIGGSQGARVDRSKLLSELTTGRRKIAVAKTKTTIEFLEGVVQQGEKVIVFSCFEEPTNAIAQHFGDAAVVLTGKTPVGKRQQLVDRFQNDDTIRVLAANIIAGGVGLNLTAARQVVFNDLDWVPANHWQAEDRAYRIGQTNTVNVTYMVASRTIDEFVASTLEAKSALIDALVEGEEVVDGDVFSALEGALARFSPQIAELSDDESGGDSVDCLLREISRDFAAKKMQAISPKAGPSSDRAIAKLAEALAGPASSKYSIKSSKRDVTYLLEVDGLDVVCSCPGFEFRGACTHARTLKQALAKGDAAEGGFELA